MTMDAYHAFLARKAILDPPTGLTKPPALPAQMFPFQRDITNWALKRGRAAVFAGTGLGKSFMELAWADAVSRATGKGVLHLAPLAVSAQLLREAAKFGIAAQHVRQQTDCAGHGVCITNYHKLEHFDLSCFGGVILDESSILKNETGFYRNDLITRCANIPFRLAATATPAPNDYMELGNHAEFLGVMSYTDMLTTFFVHDGSETQKWRLKGHAENEFWRWMASWAVMLRKPSDLGYNDDDYTLPPLNRVQHVVAADYKPNVETGMLFPMQARDLRERLAARRGSIDDRIARAVEIVIGSFRDNVSSWHGNQNTPSGDAKNTQAMELSASEESDKPARRKKTASTCASITPQTKASGAEEHPNSGSDTTPIGARSTQTILTTQPKCASKPAQSAQNPSATQSLEFSGSLLQITTPSFPTKGEDAPFADQNAATQAGDDCPSIIATAAGALEDCSALAATPRSATSATMPTYWAVQSSTFGNLVVTHWVIWCNLNSEQDALKKALGSLAISISGAHNEEEKERMHADWIAGLAPILLCKSSMFAHGLNWQHCHNTIFINVTDSFEQIYQAVRRFWRFGQTKPVTAHFIASELEGAVVANIKRKEEDFERMAAAMVLHTADISTRIVRGIERDKGDYRPAMEMQLPNWMGTAA